MANALNIKSNTVLWATLFPVQAATGEVECYAFVDMAPIVTVYNRANVNEWRNIGEVELTAYGNVDTNEAAHVEVKVTGTCPCYGGAREACTFTFKPADVLEASDYYLHVELDDISQFTDLYETEHHAHIDGPPLELA